MDKLLRLIVVTVSLLSLYGCVGDQKNHNQTDQTGPIIKIEPAPVTSSGVLQSDLDKQKDSLKQELRNEINATTQNTTSSLSGLVNTSISKLADQLNGIKADVAIKADAEIVTTLKAELKAQVDLTAKLEVQATANLEMINQLKLQIGNMETRLNANVTAQAGINNRYEQDIKDVNARAGRDVNQNFFPREAVDIIVSNESTFYKIISAICGLVVLMMSYIFKLSRQRAVQAAVDEREERQFAYNLLLEVLSMLPEGRANEVRARIDALETIRRSKPSSSA